MWLKDIYPVEVFRSLCIIIIENSAFKRWKGWAAQDNWYVRSFPNILRGTDFARYNDDGRYSIEGLMMDDLVNPCSSLKSQRRTNILSILTRIVVAKKREVTVTRDTV